MPWDLVLKQNLHFFVLSGPMNSVWDLGKKRQMPNASVLSKLTLNECLDPRHIFTFAFFFPSAWTVTLHEFTVHESQALFTYLKIILLQCFQFSVSAKISCIQSDPKCAFTTTQFFFRLTVHLLFIVFYYYKAVGDGLME